MLNYTEFLENKIVVAEKYGVDIYPNQLSEILLDHQKVIVPWCLSGGRRAIFASFGLGKTLMQLELAKQVISITNRPFLICMPLAVVGEFRRDNEMLQTGHDVVYITDTDEVGELVPQIYVTNYERVRMGDIDAAAFGGVSFDEASIIRNLKTETTNYVLKHFKDVAFRFVATATPTPNDFIEILNYADFLGVIDRGHALTRFFQRDSTKADTTIVHQDMESNSTGMILTSIPFGDHYEYSDNYNDFGHNHGNEEFFKQMDYLTPELLRTLKPGRIAAIHVKDRIRYSYQNGTSFTTISDFSGQTVSHFEKHGFYLVGKITITTDVVRENNQTYRLTWGEQRKDATKMGVGLPEYVLLFRKAPTTFDNAYADDPVIKKIDEYLLSLWQLDAHAYWKSSGDRFLSFDELSTMDMKTVFNKWRTYDPATIYNFQEHLRVCEDLAKCDRLSKLFMTIPPISNSEMVWTDINRMNTLNANQANRGKEKHICPLQLDIIERLIYRFTNEGDTVDDPFGGLFSTAYKALDLNRKAVSAELKPEYYDDGLFYLKSKEYKVAAQSLFDLLETA